MNVESGIMTPLARFWYDGAYSVSHDTTLSPEESHHLCQVLRLKKGERIWLINGMGGTALATVLEPSKEATRVRIDEVFPSKQPSRIRVCFALPKQPSQEFILRRCTELGVLGFQPLLSMHSVRERSLSSQRWQKIIREVCKQSGETWVPSILPAQKFGEWLKIREGRCLLFCNERRGTTSRDFGKDRSIGYDLLIGPEGGWSDGEVAQVEDVGGISFGLGPNRRRAETAALVATALLKNQIGEMATPTVP